MLALFGLSGQRFLDRLWVVLRWVTLCVFWSCATLVCDERLRAYIIFTHSHVCLLFVSYHPCCVCAGIDVLILFSSVWSLYPVIIIIIVIITMPLLSAVFPGLVYAGIKISPNFDLQSYGDFISFASTKSGDTLCISSAGAGQELVLANCDSQDPKQLFTPSVSVPTSAPAPPSPPASAVGDPQFTGFLGQQYQVSASTLVHAYIISHYVPSHLITHCIKYVGA